MVLAPLLFSHAVQFTLSPIELWVLPETWLSHSMMDCLGNAFYSHCPKEARPVVVPDLHAHPGAECCEFKAQIQCRLRRQKATLFHPDAVQGSSTAAKMAPQPIRMCGRNGAVESSPLNYAHIFFGTLHSALFWCWWLAGLLKLVGGESPSPHAPLLGAKVHAPDMLQMTTPLINKLLLTWLSKSYVNHCFSAIPSVPLPQGIGYGVGLAVTLFMMQGECGPGYMRTGSPFPHAEVSSLMTNQYDILTGMMIHTGVSVICRCFPPCGTLTVGHT